MSSLAKAARLDHTESRGLTRPAGRASRLGPLVNETNISFVALSGIFLHLILRYVLSVPRTASFLPLYFVLAVGGVPLLISLLKKLIVREFDSDIVAGISILTAAFLGEEQWQGKRS